VTISQVESAVRVTERLSARHADVAAALMGTRAAQVSDGGAVGVVVVGGGVLQMKVPTGMLSQQMEVVEELVV
jgi:hypothetical protein